MRYKVAYLEGAHLDWAVAKAERLPKEVVRFSSLYGCGLRVVPQGKKYRVTQSFQPSSDWSVAGPIIERTYISLTTDADGFVTEEEPWYCEVPSSNEWATGSTPLIAAMRAYVASMFGEEVELP